jgi:hypothetical protein
MGPRSSYDDRARIGPQDRELIRRWFSSREANRPYLPALLFVDCKPASRDEFLAFLGQDPGTGSSVFHLRGDTPMSYASDGGICAPLPAGNRVIEVDTGAPERGCVRHEPTDCEGYEMIEFSISERGEIVALHVTAAG